MTALLVWFLMMKMKARMKAERREEIALYVLSAFVRIVMIVYGHWQVQTCAHTSTST
jgi:cytochrome oxidase assembly protein ShyY1